MMSSPTSGWLWQSTSHVSVISDARTAAAATSRNANDNAARPKSSPSHSDELVAAGNVRNSCRQLRPVNLLLSSLGANVSCEKCCVDGFFVSNLTAEDFALRQKGFLLEHFIRPPIDVHFDLPCPCDVAFIRLKLSRASTAVQRIQIWAQTLGQADQWLKLLTSSDPGSELVLKCGNVLPPYLQMDCPSSRSSSPLHVVRSLRCVTRLRVTVLAMKDCVAVGFTGCEAFAVPSRHVPRTHAIFAKLLPKSLARGGRLERHQQTAALADDQASSQTSVARKRGAPAERSDSPTSDERSATKRTTLGCTSAQLRPRSLLSSCSSSLASSLASLPDAVPEEFLDVITVSLMTIPVVLPSGNIVDQSTLDKHVANENRWGRPASDPFTGVPLKGRPPVLTELKSRIDHYLSRNCRGKFSGPRLADGRNVSRSQVSRLLAKATPDNSDSTDSKSAGLAGHNRCPSTDASSAPSSAAKTQLLPAMKTKCGVVVAAETQPNDEARSDAEIVLSTDLKTAFAQALAAARQVLKMSYGGGSSSSPCSSSSSHEGGSQKRTKITCVNCNLLESGYRLTCGHSLCRPCTVKEATAKCATCGMHSLRADIVKINLV